MPRGLTRLRGVHTFSTLDPRPPAGVIQLFLSDIDGCLSVPYQPWDLARLAEFAALAREPHAPRLGLCTGRSYSYAEAMAQAIDARGPVLFESGAGWFALASAATRWHPALTDDVRAALAIPSDRHGPASPPQHIRNRTGNVLRHLTTVDQDKAHSNQRQRGPAAEPNLFAQYQPPKQHRKHR